ncbi:hypothetical protein [Photobacterium leiognathi]|uniref:hypothetical protein n=1 Tax=Photobacterium leiognathi TaxID=553611 RepID=UPI002981F54A|nr:hypothetical protein [Photobacterium leiognathi]
MSSSKSTKLMGIIVVAIFSICLLAGVASLINSSSSEDSDNYTPSSEQMIF